MSCEVNLTQPQPFLLLLSYCRILGTKLLGQSVKQWHRCRSPNPIAQQLVYCTKWSGLQKLGERHFHFFICARGQLWQESQHLLSVEHLALSLQLSPKIKYSNNKSCFMPWISLTFFFFFLNIVFLSSLNAILFFKSKVSPENLLLNRCYWPLESSHFPDCETNCYIRGNDTNQTHKLSKVTCTTLIEPSWFSNYRQSLDFTTTLALSWSLKTNPWKFAIGRTWWKLESIFLALHGTPLSPSWG